MSQSVSQSQRPTTLASGSIAFPFPFFPPFHSPSLFNSTLLLPCHSLIFLSLLWFKSSAALFHFLVPSPFLRSCMLWWAWGCRASAVSSRGMAPEQRSRSEDEWMWHSAIILSLFSLVSPLLSHLPLLLFTPLFPISLNMYYLSLTLCLSPLRKMRMRVAEKPI